MEAPFFYSQVTRSIQDQMENTPEAVKSHFEAILGALSGKERVVAGTKALNRYSILPGKVFAQNAKSKVKYKVIRLVADDVVLQNLSNDKIEVIQVNKLLKRWAEEGIQEISLLDEIISTVKSYLGPALGVFLTAALISWLTEKLR